jgi:hypothetical protein
MMPMILICLRNLTLETNVRIFLFKNLLVRFILKWSIQFSVYMSFTAANDLWNMAHILSPLDRFRHVS